MKGGIAGILVKIFELGYMFLNLVINNFFIYFRIVTDLKKFFRDAITSTYVKSTRQMISFCIINYSTVSEDLNKKKSREGGSTINGGK